MSDLDSPEQVMELDPSASPKEQSEQQDNVRTIIGVPPETFRKNEGTVYMYSGEELNPSGKKDDWNIATIKNKHGIEVMLMMRPSTIHGAMDGVAVYLGDDGSVNWIKADGVSKIPYEPNRSGELADLLVAEVFRDISEDNPGKTIYRARRYMSRRGKEGYSTFEHGIIRPDKLGYRIKAVKVGSGREKKKGNLIGGSLGPTEVYYDGDGEGDYNELWDLPLMKRSFVGEVNPDVETLERHFSNDLPLTITACTDGVKMIDANRKGWQSGGRVVESTVVEAIGEGNVKEELARLMNEGYFNSIDDISLVAIRLPAKAD